MQIYALEHKIIWKFQLIKTFHIIQKERGRVKLKDNWKVHVRTGSTYAAEAYTIKFFFRYLNTDHVSKVNDYNGLQYWLIETLHEILSLRLPTGSDI